MAKLPRGINFTDRSKPGYGRVLTLQAAAFVAELHRAFEGERQRLLMLRVQRQKLFEKGALPDFLAGTASVRAGTWKVATIPTALQDRRVEIIGSTERQAMIEAFNSGAKTFVAAFSTGASWENLAAGQINLMDRWTSKMEFIEPGSGKRQGLSGKPAVLLVRPRPLHLDEVHMKVDGKPVAGAFFDMGLYLFHNAKTALSKTSGPFFCLSRLESHLEARLWNQIFILAQSLLGLKLGTIKSTVMIETLPASFEMDEIIFELRDHLAGLNCCHSGLIFSFIKIFHNRRDLLLPDRNQIVASEAFLAAYSALLVKTCHRRGCLAIGDAATKTDIEHEARSGFDGTAVSHPSLVPAAVKLFNELVPTSNQLYVARDDVKVGQKEMLEIPEGTRTEDGFRENIRTSLREDMVEIVEAQIWQWLSLGVKLDSGRKITRSFFHSCLAQEIEFVKGELGAEAYSKSRFKEAVARLKALAASKTFKSFGAT